MMEIEMEATQEELIEALAHFEFLKGLGPAYLAYIAECASAVSLSAGEPIIKEQQAADEFYLIGQGKVALGTFVSSRGFITIQILQEGELVGWSWLVAPYQWRFEALTITPVRVIAVSGIKLRQQCEEDHDFGYELLKRLTFVIGERLEATRLQLKN
jgi:CRP-like cAMP-binding protein